jgi:hypothetical protein
LGLPFFREPSGWENVICLQGEFSSILTKCPSHLILATISVLLWLYLDLIWKTLSRLPKPRAPLWWFLVQRCCATTETYVLRAFSYFRHDNYELLLLLLPMILQSIFWALPSSVLRFLNHTQLDTL